MKSWVLPLPTISEANYHGHWSKLHKLHKQHRTRIAQFFKYQKPDISLPCTIKLTRLSPRTLDADDNLRSAFKSIKDYIADHLIPGLAAGRADSDPRIKWDYGQEKSKQKAIRIEIM